MPASPAHLSDPAFGNRLLAVVLGFFVVLFAVQPALSATIQTDLWIYQYGDTVTVTGADYGSAETVELVTTDPYGVEVDRGTALTDDLGTFTYQFVLDSDVPGIYDVVGTGLISGLVAVTQFDPAVAIVTPTSKNFGSVAVGSSSAAEVFTLQNSGNTVMNSIVISLAGTNPGQFVLNTSGTATTLAAGASTTFSVSFSPTSTGLKSATAEVGSNANPDPSIPLSGTGTAADTTAPTLTLTSLAPDPTNSSPISVTAQFSETVTGFSAADITAGNATVGNFVAVDGDTYTFDLTPSAQGSVTADVAAGAASDGAGNGNTAAAQFSRLFDSVDPSVSIALNPSAPDGDNGWYVSDVTVTVAALDSGTGVDGATIEYSLDGGTSWLPYTGAFTISADGVYTVDARASDLAGNTGDASQATFSIDKTAPTAVTGTPDRAPDHNGWYSAPVLITFSGTDALSGIDFCSSASYSGPDDAAASQPGTCTDAAGNVGNGDFGLMYDQTDPSVTISLDPAAPDGNNGWYASDVEVTLAASDTTSGIDTVEYSLDGGATWDPYTAPFSVSDDGSHTVDARTSDKAGNTDGADQASFQIDQTDPGISLFSHLPAENLNGWNNTDVTLTWECMDATSGVVDQFVSNTESVEGENYDSTQTCEDNAGNTASDTTQVSIDKTAPTAVTGTADRAPDHNGWYSAPVLITFSGTDAVSGIDFCSSASYSGPDSGTAVQNGSCTDEAGNVGTGQFGLMYDATAPQVLISLDPSTPNGSNAWYTSSVEITLTATDATSLIDTVEVNVDGAGWEPYTSPFTVSADGTHTVDARTADNAGNSDDDTASFQIDQTDPTISIALDAATPTGDNDWYVSDVEVTLTATDDTSGIDTVEYSFDGGAWTDYTGPITVSADGSHTVDARTSDNAGNIDAADQASFKIDQTAPTIAFATRLPEPNAAGWNNTDVTVTWSCTDDTSGPVDATVADTVSSEGAGQFASAHCADEAGNVSGTDSIGDINIDKTAPSITDLGPTTSANSAGWYNANVSNEFQATDSLSGLNALCGAAFPAAGSIQSKTTTGEGMGLHVTSDSCTDDAGNTATAVTSIGFNVDKTAPDIDDLGPTSLPNGAGWYNHDVTNEFQATDGLSGLGATCLAAFPAAGNVQSKTTTGEGTSVNIASDSCTDVADNTAAGINSANFKVDKTDPSVEISSPADGSSTIALTIPVSGTASDGLSGVESVRVNGLPTTYGAGAWFGSVPLSCGANTITAMALDFASNSQTDTITVTRICFSNLQFYQPLDQTSASASQPVVNIGKFGRVIPTKVTFKLDDGTVVTDAVAAARGWTIQIGVNSASCVNGAATDSLEAYADAGQSSAGTNLFRWTSSQWIYNLDTGNAPQVAMTINKCYRLDVYVSDGFAMTKVSTATYAIFKPTK